MIKIIQVDSLDNVAIPLSFLPKGTRVCETITALDDIPQGHKIALCDLAKGDAVKRYGMILGYLNRPISGGNLINEHMISLPTIPVLKDLKPGERKEIKLPALPCQTFEGYPLEGHEYAGTRNILGIMTTVQCVSGVLNKALIKMKEELLPHFPNVDDIVALNHEYGCGVAIDAQDAPIPKRALRHLLRNPNFGGEIMLLSLGCEKLTIDMLLEPHENTPENVIILQNFQGYEAMIAALINMAESKLKKLNKRKRETLPLSKLCVGMQCGGSDAFSGITANPAAGLASDLLVKAGATVMFSEVTEVRDGVHMLSERCISQEVVNKLIKEMAWYDSYLEKGGVDRSANPTPGNKKGGLSNIIEKAMGSIAKSGKSPIVEILSPGEIPTRKGLIFAATPASDFVCGTMQLTSGITLQVFMTGRGTPYGLSAVPVIKVCSRSELQKMWSDLIDIDAGTIAAGKESIDEVGIRLFEKIINVASGREKTCAEEHELYNDLCLFNPAPIT
jgi:galactarate dehydratase